MTLAATNRDSPYRRVGIVRGEQRRSEPCDGQRAEQHDDAEGEDGVPRDPRLTDPADDERHEAQPEEEEQVSHQHGPVDPAGRLQQVMVLEPVDPDLDEGQRVSGDDPLARGI